MVPTAAVSAPRRTRPPLSTQLRPSIAIQDGMGEDEALVDWDYVDDPAVPEPVPPPPSIAGDGGLGNVASSSNAPRRASFGRRVAGSDRPVRSMAWGPFTVAPIVQAGEELCGWGAVCGKHRNDGDGEKVQCKIQVTMGKSLSADECRLRVKA
eukprot:4836505-Lingulodinium_polyedra.AAC.1